MSEISPIKKSKSLGRKPPSPPRKWKKIQLSKEQDLSSVKELAIQINKNEQYTRHHINTNELPINFIPIRDEIFGHALYNKEIEREIKIDNIKKYINESNYPYKLITDKLLGIGKFGLVYEAYKEIPTEGKIEKETGYVVKIFISEDSKEDDLFDLEIKMLNYILEKCGECKECPEFICYDSSLKYGYIKLLVFKNAGKNLKTFLAENPKLDDMIREDLCEQLTMAVNKLHNFNVFHGDLKPDNITIYEMDGMYMLKLIDFGVATLLDKQLDDWMGNMRFYNHNLTPINKATKIINEINAIKQINEIIRNPIEYLKSFHDTNYKKYLKYKIKYIKLKN